MTEDLYSLILPNNVLSPFINTTELSRILSLVISSTAPCMNTLATSTLLHPSYPCVEPILSSGASATYSIYSQKCVVPFQDTNSDFYGRPVSGSELLLFYSIPRDTIPMCGNWSQLDNILDALLPGFLLICMVDAISSSISRLGRIYDTLLVDDNDTSDGALCYHVKPSPKSDLDWDSVYIQNSDASRLFIALRSLGGKHLSTVVINSVAMGYCQYLRKHLIHKLFSHYHTGPTGAHVGEYKIFFRLQLRFYWSTMRDEVTLWCKGCAHFFSYNV